MAREQSCVDWRGKILRGRQTGPTGRRAKQMDDDGVTLIQIQIQAGRQNDHGKQWPTPISTSTSCRRRRRPIPFFASFSSWWFTQPCVRMCVRRVCMQSAAAAAAAAGGRTGRPSFQGPKTHSLCLVWWSDWLALFLRGGGGSRGMRFGSLDS